MSAGDQWGSGPGGAPPEGYGAPRPTNPVVIIVAVLNFVIGGLSIICGIITFVGMAALADLARHMGGLASLLATLAVIFAILLLAVGGCGIASGVGVLNRRSWGRTLTFVVAGLCILIALWAFLGVLNGAVVNLVAVLLYAGYAVAVLVLLLNPQNAREFS